MNKYILAVLVSLAFASSVAFATNVNHSGVNHHNQTHSGNNHHNITNSNNSYTPVNSGNINNTNHQHQGQDQNQHQGQGQNQNANSNQSQSANNAGNTQGLSNTNNYQRPYRNTPSMANFTPMPTSPCMGTYGASGSGPGLGISFAGSIINVNCEIQEAARNMVYLGDLETAFEIACTGKHAQGTEKCLTLAINQELIKTELTAQLAALQNGGDYVSPALIKEAVSNLGVADDAVTVNQVRLITESRQTESQYVSTGGWVGFGTSPH